VLTADVGWDKYSSHAKFDSFWFDFISLYSERDETTRGFSNAQRRLFFFLFLCVDGRNAHTNPPSPSSILHAASRVGGRRRMGLPGHINSALVVRTTSSGLAKAPRISIAPQLSNLSFHSLFLNAFADMSGNDSFYDFSYSKKTGKIFRLNCRSSVRIAYWLLYVPTFAIQKETWTQQHVLDSRFALLLLQYKSEGSTRLPFSCCCVTARNFLYRIKGFDFDLILKYLNGCCIVLYTTIDRCMDAHAS